MALKSTTPTRLLGLLSGIELILWDKSMLEMRLTRLKQRDTKLKASGVLMGSPLSPYIGIARNAMFPAKMMEHFSQSGFCE